MKTKLLSTMIAAGVIALSQNALAADGTITFNGSITAQTCTINGGVAATNFTVTLPPVSSASLASAGQTAGRTPFNIALTNCTGTGGNVHTYFEAGSTTDASGNLNLDANGATNVQLGLLNSDATAIKAGYADASQNSKAVAITGGSATLSYFVQYVATGVATAGAATSKVLYT
ncbi:fimbrial protein, partial [Cupriavidus basilensis]